MKHSFAIFPMAAVMCAAALSCAHGGRPCTVEVDMQVPARQMGDSIASNLGCEDAARTIVEWLSSDSPAEIGYARELTQCVAYNYQDSMPKFLHAIDSIGATLAPERRVRLLLRTCEPEYLGHLVCMDPNDSILVPMIERVLAVTPEKLALFRRGYQTEKSK